MQSKKYIISVALTVAIGGFLLGFDATVTSGTVPFIKKYFDQAVTSGDLRLGWAVSCLGWGALGGNAVAGFFSDRFGRKKVLIVTALLPGSSALLSALGCPFVSIPESKGKSLEELEEFVVCQTRLPKD